MQGARGASRSAAGKAAAAAPASTEANEKKMDGGAARRPSKRRREAASKYQGVDFHKSSKKWRARIESKGKCQHIGYFADEKAAALAYDIKARELKGPSAKTNLDAASAAAVAAAFDDSFVPARARGANKYRGVNYHKSSKKWRARIEHGGKSIHIGYFNDEKTAAFAYDDKARSLKGEGAQTNFDAEAAKAAAASAGSFVPPRARGANTYRGVNFHKNSQKWRARIEHGGKCHHIGYFDDEQQAALIYDAKARELKGERAITNFDDAEAATAAVKELLSSKPSRAARSSRFKGVSFNKRANKWSATLRKGGVTHHLGYFDKEEEAAKAFDTKARELSGANAKTNFDESGNATATAAGAAAPAAPSAPPPANEDGVVGLDVDGVNNMEQVFTIASSTSSEATPLSEYLVPSSSCSRGLSL